MKTRRVLKWCEATALWAGLGLLAVLVFSESRLVWQGRDACAQGQIHAPAPAFDPADWRR